MLIKTCYHAYQIKIAIKWYLHQEPVTHHSSFFLFLPIKWYQVRIKKEIQTAERAGAGEAGGNLRKAVRWQKCKNKVRFGERVQAKKSWSSVQSGSPNPAHSSASATWPAYANQRLIGTDVQSTAASDQGRGHASITKPTNSVRQEASLVAAGLGGSGLSYSWGAARSVLHVLL